MKEKVLWFSRGGALILGRFVSLPRAKPKSKKNRDLTEADLPPIASTEAA